MSELQYFQRYTCKENHHSSNVLYFLKRLYLYSPKKFYSVLQEITERQDFSDYFYPDFITQDTNSKKSIPDFSIAQKSFKIIVEAKENGNSFSRTQLEKHLEGLEETKNYEYKVLIALSPSNTSKDMIQELNDKYNNKNIYVVHKTYLDLYDFIANIIDETRDTDFYEILEDYRDYCVQEGLIDKANDTLMVRLSGQTFDFNYANGVYYDSIKHTPLGFKYLGLYRKQHVEAIGKIVKIVEAHKNNNGITEYGKICYGSALTLEEKERVELAMINRENIYHSSTAPQYHFLVEKFIPVENFKKERGALFGKKKFSLKDDFKIEDVTKVSIEDIASAMKDYNQWK